MGALSGGTLEFVKLKDKGDSIKGKLSREPDVHDYYPYDATTEKKSTSPQKTKKGNIRQEISLFFEGEEGVEQVLNFLQWGNLATALDAAADEAGVKKLEDYVGRTVSVERLTPFVKGSMTPVEFKVSVS